MECYFSAQAESRLHWLLRDLTRIPIKQEENYLKSAAFKVV